MNEANTGIVQMNRGSMKGRWYCYRKGGLEHLHADGSWKTGASDGAYFDSKEEIEALLKTAAA